MADSGTATEQANGSSSDVRKTALRAAAIAAASGATALAAKRAFSSGGQDSQSSGDGDGGGERSGGRSSGGRSDSLMGGMLNSSWSSARDALVPFAGDAAKAGGEYLAKNGPEFVRDTIVPSFIDGFQNAQTSDD